jgi:putative ABC transport system permease protein
VGHPLTLTSGQGIVLFCLSALILLTITITSGCYPAWQLSRVNPALTVRGNITKFANTGLIKKILTVGQFAIAIVLFIFIATVSEQLIFINQKDLGFDKGNLLCIDNNNWGTKSQAFKQGLLEIAGVTSVSISTWNPARGQGYMSTEVNDSKDSAEKIRIWYISGDHDLALTLKLQLIEGDSLRDQPPDTGVDIQPVLITEYTAKLFGIKSLNEPNPILRGKPVGILKNFNNGSLRYPTTPCVINVLPSPTRGYILLRTTGLTNLQLPDRLRRLWRQFYPEKLLQFNWISDSLALQYSEEARLQKRFSVLALLSLLLTLLGLFGQVAYSVDQRVKEIGIRKALGAPVSGILLLISGKYIKLIGVAIAIASPIALWISSAWLREYAYRINLTWETFVSVWLLIFSVALLTLALSSVRTAAQKPAIALRVE